MWSLEEQHRITHRNMASMQSPVEFPNCIQLFQVVVLAISFQLERKGTPIKQIKGKRELTTQRKDPFLLCALSA